ncbi:hypothetical protein, partial [Mesorhizobium sp. M7A.F.Ca.CA.004.12.1.1]|uniref:hypothetical protein n=1 Tax=Mesorhizobium sp. M7A.F.Ca.CA.004.12.1.1 TaxID=2496732 RepID=UPI0019CFE6C1
ILIRLVRLFRMPQARGVGDRIEDSDHRETWFIRDASQAFAVITSSRTFQRKEKGRRGACRNSLFRMAAFQ